MALNNRIKELRESKNMSQPALAKLIGVSMHSVWRWENGKVEPRACELQELAKVFNCKVDDLLNPPKPSTQSGKKDKSRAKGKKAA